MVSLVPYRGLRTAPDAAVDSSRSINRKHCTDKLTCGYAHVGLYDVQDRRAWIARDRWGSPASGVSHARLLKGGTNASSTAEKDRFLCYWFHTPGAGQGPVQGYPIDWSEGHLMVRLEPNWSYSKLELIPATQTRRIEKNIEKQYRIGELLFEAYTELGPPFPLSWHMVGPRPADSMFYVERREAPEK